jgi:hypothetical protein
MKAYPRSILKMVRRFATDPRLADVMANQAAFTYALAHTDLTNFTDPSSDAPLSSRTCHQADCGVEYVRWLEKVGQPVVMSRKSWEHVAILRAIEAANLLSPGMKGLGFGVGREPLVPEFAFHGVDLVATDLATEDSRSDQWAATGQHALSLADLCNSRLCPDEVVKEHTILRSVDMTRIPDDLRGFDFVWSACALEHLGTLEAGFAFVERAMDCLRPGGLAVHTTEFNLESNDATATKGQTVLYRRKDLEGLEERMAQLGHLMYPFSVSEPSGVFDFVIDMEPYHYGSLIVRFGGFLTTSAVIVVQKGT